MPDLIVPVGSRLHAALLDLATDARCVFFAGLPGTGKSLLIHQTAQLGHGRGRRVHLLQWDVARPAFEGSPAGQRYPTTRGVTHGVIRIAVGRWARHAVAQWHETHAGPEDLLIGETPLVGHRFVELVRPAPDAAETVLGATSTRFVIPVPSREVRRHLEAERERRARSPVHQREQEDAPPEVLRDLWRQLVSVADALAVIPAGSAAEGALAFDPAIYAEVYERVLRHRHATVLTLDTILPTARVSAYDFRFPTEDLLPSSSEVEHFIREAVTACADDGALERILERWYVDDA